MRETYTALYAHIVFAPKGRARSIHPDAMPRLHAYLAGIARNLGCTPIAVNGTDDHVHLLLHYPARLSISEIVMKLKANSSRWLHETFPMMQRFAWQDGYAALSVSQTRVPRVRDYIERQQDHHAQRAFLHEWDEILRAIEPPPAPVAADAARVEPES